MHARHALPRLWLMTDERQGDALWTALARLPRGSGIVFRHYRLPAAERHALFVRVRKISRRKRLLLVMGGDEKTAHAWGADGWHGRGRGRMRSIRTAPIHDLREMRSAESAGATLLFLSPVFATRSHPRGRMLGRLRFGLLARSARLPIIALGGMTEKSCRTLPGAYGWAAIDAWTAEPDQKRKAVPR